MSASYNIFGYEPSEPGAFVSAAIFGVLTIVVVIINIRFKSWFFMVIPIASLMEFIGFVVRPYSATSVPKYIVSSLCILLAPTIYAMADYALIAKTMIRSGVSHPIFKPKVVRYIFLVADIFSFTIQVCGGGLTAISDISIAQTGSKILLSGLAAALCVFVFFLCMLVYLHFHLRRKGNLTEEGYKGEKLIFILYIDMILLIIRSVYRVAEYGNLEYHNSISTNEELFYGLDVLEMAILNALWIPFHPGFWGMKGGDDDEEEKPQTEMGKVTPSP